MTAPNFYRVLGIVPDASADEVRAAYARLVKRHPGGGAGGRWRRRRSPPPGWHSGYLEPKPVSMIPTVLIAISTSSQDEKNFT